MDTNPISAGVKELDETSEDQKTFTLSDKSRNESEDTLDKDSESPTRIKETSETEDCIDSYTDNRQTISDNEDSHCNSSVSDASSATSSNKTSPSCKLKDKFLSPVKSEKTSEIPFYVSPIMPVITKAVDLERSNRTRRTSNSQETELPFYLSCNPTDHSHDTSESSFSLEGNKPLCSKKDTFDRHRRQSTDDKFYESFTDKDTTPRVQIDSDSPLLDKPSPDCEDASLLISPSGPLTSYPDASNETSPPDSDGSNSHLRYKSDDYFENQEDKVFPTDEPSARSPCVQADSDSPLYGTPSPDCDDSNYTSSYSSLGNYYDDDDDIQRFCHQEEQASQKPTDIGESLADESQGDISSTSNVSLDRNFATTMGSEKVEPSGESVTSQQTPSTMREDNSRLRNKSVRHKKIRHLSTKKVKHFRTKKTKHFSSRIYQSKPSVSKQTVDLSQDKPSSDWESASSLQDTPSSDNDDSNSASSCLRWYGEEHEDKERLLNPQDEHTPQDQTISREGSHFMTQYTELPRDEYLLIQMREFFSTYDVSNEENSGRLEGTNSFTPSHFSGDVSLPSELLAQDEELETGSPTEDDLSDEKH